MLPGTNHRTTKDYNRRIVLKAIAFGAPVSRAEVARQTLLTPQAISNIVSDLIEEGLVLERFAERTRGPRSIALDLNPEGAYAIGLSMDPFHVSAVLANVVGDVEARIRLPGSYAADPEAALDLFAKAVHELLADRPAVRDRLWGVGLGLPGPIDPIDKALVNIEGFPAWVGIPVADRLEPRIDLPVYVENNATAAAIGEAWFGKGREFQHFFYFFITKGIGAGVIINGEPYHGVGGFTGEVGLIPGPAASGVAAQRMDNLISLDALQAKLGAEARVLDDPSQLEHLWQQRDSGVMAWLNEAGSALASVLVTVEYLLDPEAVVVSGHLPEPLLDELLEVTRRAMEKLRTYRKPHCPQLVKGMGGENYSALGVATLPIYDAIAPNAERLRVRQRVPTD